MSDPTMLANERRRAREMDAAIRARGQALGAAARRMAVVLSADDHVNRVVLFGSLSRGDVTLYSDMDIAVAGLPTDAYLDAWLAVEQASGGLPFDLVRVEDASEPLRDEISRGTVLYDRAR